MTPALTLEQTFCDARYFGQTDATPVQVAICRAADGRPLADLADHPDVVTAFGGPEAIAALPIGVIPRRVEVYSGVRTGKSLLSAAAGFCMARRVDLSVVRPGGEMPRVTIVSVDTDKAAVVKEHLSYPSTARPEMKRLLVADPTRDSIIFKHPRGTPIEICCAAGRKAGATVRARWSAGLVLDEAPLMDSAVEDYAVNIEDLITAVEGRLLPGAQTWLIGSLWAPIGECYKSVQNYWGKPSADRVVVKTPAWTMNPVWWSEARVRHLEQSNPRAYRSEVLAEFTSGIAAVFTQDEVREMFRPKVRSLNEAA